MQLSNFNESFIVNVNQIVRHVLSHNDYMITRVEEQVLPLHKLCM